MPAERLALYTTMYPGVEPYLRDWYTSVRAQTESGFELCVGLDGLSPADVTRAVGLEFQARWIPGARPTTPARLRSDAITQLVRDYDAVIFVDSDDVLLPARVAAARQQLARADVTGCALEIMDHAGQPVGAQFCPPSGIASATLLPRWNVFGLSNTAYRSATLDACLPVPDDCVLVDWLLATRAWSNGARLEFDATPHMRYRQYDANLAPVLQPFSGHQVLIATSRVLEHYRCMLDVEWELGRHERAALEAERRRVSTFDAAVRRDKSRLDAYVTALNRLPAMHVWWWQVAHPDLEHVWSN
ncbi:MAG TPA: hypothetical protein VFK36_03070 [Gemmatimonadales bacterium]|nr:hypothetical protein [Gemmatimonadales bacterium]